MKNISKKMFFLSYSIYMLYCIINTSFYSIYIYKFEKAIMILCALIIIFSEIICNKMSIKELLFMIVCIILLSILLLHMNGIVMLPMFLYIYAARKIEFKQITKFTVIESALALLFIIISAKIGIITNYQITTIEYNLIRTRTYLGFRYALFPQMLLFNITLCNLYIHKDKITIIRCLVLGILNYWMYCYTDARLSFYLIIALIIALYLVSKYKTFFTKRRILTFILILSFPICALFSIYMTVNYNSSNPIMNKVNQILGGRLMLGKRSLNEYEINLFGHDVQYVGAGLDVNGERALGTYNFVDCLYINMLEKYGIIFNVVLWCLLTYSLYIYWNKKDYFLLIILVGLALRGIIDNLEMYLYYNTFWLALIKYQKNKNTELLNKADSTEGIK